MLSRALDRGRFPCGQEDTFGEHCRWLVAISRVREGTSYFGLPDNNAELVEGCYTVNPTPGGA